MDQAPQQQPDPTEQLTRRAYYQLIHTLYALLPPPLADTPEALLARNDAAIAKVAALLPVNADEADLAAHCICARAQAEDVMRLTRFHAGDILLVMKLNAQYALMERTGVSIRTQLLRVQTARYKREKDGTAANADEWASYIATRRMQQALDPGTVPVVPATTSPPAPLPPASPSPPPAQVAPPPPPPAPAPPASPSPPSAQVAPPAPQSPAPLPPMPPARPSPPPARVALPAPPPARLAPPALLPARVAAPPGRHRTRTVAEIGEPPRDLAAEADRYAIVYPRRARPIRQYGGLPPNCDFGPPDDELVHAIVTGTSPALCALDGPAAAMA